MSIGVHLVTKNVHKFNNPALYDQGPVMMYASVENPVIEVSIPELVLDNIDEFASYQRVVAYLKRYSAYVREDFCFGQGSVSYFLYPGIYGWVTNLLIANRPYKDLSFSPDLFMVMMNERGIPESITGDVAIQLVHWLRETFTVTPVSSRAPKLAIVDVKSIGVSSSVIEITIDKAYAGLLIGKGGITIKAIREGVAAMYGHKFAIVTVKTV